MPGRRDASRRLRRREVRRRIRIRRVGASSFAAVLAVGGAVTIDSATFPYDLGGRDGSATDTVVVAQPAADAALADAAPADAAPADAAAADDRELPLSRAGDRPGVAPAPVGVDLNVVRGKPEPAAPLPADSGTGKRVVFDITGQQVWLVDEDESVVRTHMVSASIHDQLEAGTYEVFSASRHATSWTETETMEYMVRFAHGKNSNIGFHDIPVKKSTGEEVQTLDQLGTPLSDGCIRQDHEDAQALYEFAPVGTTVVVVRT